MKKVTAILLLIIIAFVIATSQSNLSLSQESTLSKNVCLKDVANNDFTTEPTDFFTSTNWFLLSKQGNGNIRINNLNYQTSIKTIHGFDRLFQLLFQTRINYRKYVINHQTIHTFLSYRQKDGYYFYHLCKMLH